MDIKGGEPIKKFAGTVSGFVEFMYSVKTGIGSSTGTTAHEAMLRMGKINGLKPANTGPFNTCTSRYIYTEKGGWIDMSHFMFYSGRAYMYKMQKEQAQRIINSKGFAFYPVEDQTHFLKQSLISPQGEAIQEGYLQERFDGITAPHSAYSYEDLPTDRFAADFGANYFDPNSNKTFAEQIQEYLNNVLKATSPQNAPNYNSLPNEYPVQPTLVNKSTTPVFVKTNP